MTADLYSDVVPMLSDFLAIEQKQATSTMNEEDKVEEHYFF
jgi:hypothetical protein